MGTYERNPECTCDWCRNDGKPIGGYWSTHIHAGERVWQSNDSYGNEHIPPRRAVITPTH